MTLRFVDLDIQRTPAARDFITRKRSPSLTQQFLVCLSLVATGATVTLMVDDSRWLIANLLIVLGLASAYVTSQTNRNRNLVQTTEFQNALFSSALTKDYTICLIVGTDGKIVYCNQGFTAMFPTSSIGSDIAHWLTQGKASSTDSARIMESIGKSDVQQFSIRMEGGDQKSHALSMRTESIPRPNGFYLLRGTETKDS